jgi:hypothetical protein
MSKDTTEDANLDPKNDEPKKSPEPTQIKDADLEKISGGWWHDSWTPQQ